MKNIDDFCKDYDSEKIQKIAVHNMRGLSEQYDEDDGYNYIIDFEFFILSTNICEELKKTSDLYGKKIKYNDLKSSIDNDEKELLALKANVLKAILNKKRIHNKELLLESKKQMLDVIKLTDAEGIKLQKEIDTVKAKYFDQYFASYPAMLLFCDDPLVANKRQSYLKDLVKTVLSSISNDTVFSEEDLIKKSLDYVNIGKTVVKLGNDDWKKYGDYFADHFDHEDYSMDD